MPAITTHPKMSRSAYEQLPEDQHYPFGNADRTVTIDRLGAAGERFRVDVELVEEELFSLGRLVMTTALSDELELAGVHRTYIALLLVRHLGGDWGELPEEDHLSNDEAVELGHRILSEYRLTGIRVWIITEHDRSVTTLLRPDDY